MSTQDGSDDFKLTSKCLPEGSVFLNSVDYQEERLWPNEKYAENYGQGISFHPALDGSNA